MAVGANFPVEGIEHMASQVKSSAANLETTLSQLRVSCQRDPSFAGNAAEQYDKYLHEWDSGQRNLIEGLNGAAGLLESLARNLRGLDQSATKAFNV